MRSHENFLSIYLLNFLCLGKICFIWLLIAAYTVACALNAAASLNRCFSFNKLFVKKVLTTSFNMCPR